MKRTSWGAALAVAFMAVGMVGACGKTESAPQPATMAGQERSGAVTKVTANENGFSPGSISVRRGEHVMLEFTRTTDSTCATKVAFPELNVTKDLPLNVPVQVHVPTDQSRTLTFQCGMGMYKSSVVIN